MAEPRCIGIDFGTDSVRVVLIGADTGAQEGRAVVPYPRWSEGRYCDAAANQFRQHPLDYLESLERACRQLTGGLSAPQRDSIIGIGVDTTGSTVCAADRAAAQRTIARGMRIRCLRGTAAVPSECAYTRFQRRLFDHEQEVLAMFHQLVDQLQVELPDLGQALALDGKELHSYARKESTYPQEEDQEDTDGRRDRDADWGVKGRGKKKRSWFGFLLHLVVDANYELPVAVEVTRASAAEQPVAQQLLDQLEQRHDTVLERCAMLSADKGYDDSKLIKRLWDQHQIKPVIDIRNCWQDGETSKLVEGQDNVLYSFDGQVSCMCPKTGDEHRMYYAGFEGDRNTLKYRCPAHASGIECKGMDQCPLAGKAVRIPLAEDRRVFTPVARSSYLWKDYYDQRSAVERVNSRLAGPYGFEHPFIRGLAKMRLRCSMALTVMLAMALGRIQAGQPEHLRCLVKSA